MITLSNLWKTSFESKKKTTCGKQHQLPENHKFMTYNCWPGYLLDAFLQNFENSHC